MVALFDLNLARADELRRWQSLFEHDGNKAAAWRCYRLARTWGLPIPLSVLAELDRVAAAFDSEVDRARALRNNPGRGENDNAGLSTARVGRIVTEAGPGSTDPAVGLLDWERDFEISSAVEMLRRQGWTEAAAVERVALGTIDLAWGIRIQKDTVIVGPVPTPARSAELVRRAVRRVKALAKDTTETPDLNDAT